jgi:iron complex transport system substrate-binding protein
MFRRASKVWLAAAALALAGSIGFAQQVMVTHARGETTLRADPEKVFSFDYGAIDTLYHLGVVVDGVAQPTGTTPSWFPSDYVVIGSLFEPDYELIAAEQPGLVVVGGRSAPAYDQLSRLAPTIDVSSTGDVMGDLRRNVTALAAVFGKEAEGQRLLDDIEKRMEALRAAVSEGGDGLVVMVTGGSVTVVAEDNLRGQFMYGELGLRSTVEDIADATHGEPVSFEFLLQHDPTWLFVIDRDAAVGTADAQPAYAVLDNEIVRQTKAWREGRIVFLDPFDWYIVGATGVGTVNSMIDALDAVYGLQ